MLIGDQTITHHPVVSRFLDLTPKGRNETGPNFDMSDWVRHHDKYDHMPTNGSHACCGSEG